MNSLEMKEIIENYLLIWNLEYGLTNFYYIQSSQTQNTLIIKKDARFGDKSGSILYFKDGRIIMNTSRRWVTSKLVNQEKLKCNKIKKSIAHYVFSYDVNNEIELLAVLSRFEEYINEIIMS